MREYRWRTGLYLCGLALVVSSCGGGSDKVSEESKILSPSPLMVELKRQIGFTLSDVYGAQLDKKGDVVRECMSKSGFAPREEEIPSRRIQNYTPKIFGGMADQAIKTLDSMDAPTAIVSDETLADPARQAVVEMCFAEARAVADPLAAYFDYISRVGGDMESRVQASKAVIDARKRSETCFLGLGYGASDSSSMAEVFVVRSNSIIADVGGGVLAVERGRVALHTLSAEENALESKVNECWMILQVQESAIRAKVEDEFLRENSSQMSEVMRDVQTSLRDSLEVYLSKESGTIKGE